MLVDSGLVINKETKKYKDRQYIKIITNTLFYTTK
jgi:hypothetical protein